MNGYTFRRQRPVMNYIADFCCLQLKLIIELDGITHHDASTEIKDQLKDEALTKNGFTVLRFTDTEVLNEISNVRKIIAEWIDDYELNFSSRSTPGASRHPRQRGI
jgi:very-short-patch-repair endonuclease